MNKFFPLVVACVLLGGASAYAKPDGVPKGHAATPAVPGKETGSATEPAMPGNLTAQENVDSHRHEKNGEEGEAHHGKAKGHDKDKSQGKATGHSKDH